jgi:hypothetical protein
LELDLVEVAVSVACFSCSRNLQFQLVAVEAEKEYEEEAEEENEEENEEEEEEAAEYAEEEA